MSAGRPFHGADIGETEKAKWAPSNYGLKLTAPVVALVSIPWYSVAAA